jgi:metallophosphoesterase (TIGR00282 family)
MARVLFLGDIVGRAGRSAVIAHIGALKKAHAVDCVIANGENAAGGAGLNRGIAEQLLAAGVDGLTLGDHCWDQRGFDRDIAALERVCRPINLYGGSPGLPYLVLEAAGMRIGVLTVLGQTLVKIRSDAGFPRIHGYLDELRDAADHWIVEMHAETTSERVAMGWYLDGRVAAVVGSHTHIPTADARRLPRGTGYLSDLGMCGPYDSVLGREVGPIIGHFVDGMPRKFEVASANVQLRGALIEVAAGKRGCVAFEPFRFDVPAVEGDS